MTPVFPPGSFLYSGPRAWQRAPRALVAPVIARYSVDWKTVLQRRLAKCSGEVAARFGIGFTPPGWDNLATTFGKDKSGRQALLETGLAIERNDGSGIYDRFRDRIQFPIHDRRGRTVGFGGRVLGDDTPKYLNSPESVVFHKGSELYGLYEAKHALRQIDRIMVVEGYMDVVALAQNGIDYAVASLGTATTSDQIQKILRTCHEIVFCYDGDNAGKKAAWRALENSLPLLRDGHVFRFLFLPEGEDNPFLDDPWYVGDRQAKLESPRRAKALGQATDCRTNEHQSRRQQQ